MVLVPFEVGQPYTHEEVLLNSILQCRLLLTLHHNCALLHRQKVEVLSQVTLGDVPDVLSYRSNSKQTVSFCPNLSLHPV